MKNERAPVNDVIGIIQRRLNMAEKVGADSATDRAIAAECRTILDVLRQSAAPVAITNSGMGGIEWLVPLLEDDVALYTHPAPVVDRSLQLLKQQHERLLVEMHRLAACIAELDPDSCSGMRLNTAKKGAP